MSHVRSCAVVAATLAAVVSTTDLRAQKKAPSPPPIPVTAWFESVDPAHASTAVQPSPFCEFAGSIAADTGHFTTAPGATCTLAFGDETFLDVPRADLAPQAGAVGTAVSFFVRNVGRASVTGDPIAGQFGLNWRAASGDGVTRAHRLQYGDVYDDSIDYAHTTCTETNPDDLRCQRWEVTSTVATGIATGEGNARDTGPLARLSVITGSGAKGVVVLASSLPVHYKLVITRAD
jgi:hypothetical protein